ncbi:hypothetical protein OIV19_06000 [Brucella sp. HL-2]|nr:hypothetical protein [Brucella sp. HL-2]MCV9907171.1 hypothetical protein [Brucella sp. HL-2]
MAKAAKATETNKTVPAAEVVGGPLPNQNDANQSGTTASNDANSTNASQATASTVVAGDLTSADIEEMIAASVQVAKEAGWDFVAAAVEAFAAKHGKLGCNGIRITAKVEGIRRGGRRHNGTNEYPVHEFEPLQLNQILGDPDLVAELIELEE